MLSFSIRIDSSLHYEIHSVHRHLYFTHPSRNTLALDVAPNARANAANKNSVRNALTIAIALVLICCATLGAQNATEQSTQTKVDPETIKQLIALLGDPTPSIRRNAKAELIRIGSVATSELEKASKFETTLDHEIQITAAEILETFQDTIAVRETDKFVRGSGTLPGWQAFEKITGDTPVSRSLFRDIYLQNRLELERAFGPSPANTRYHQFTVLFESTDLEQVCFGMFLLARQQSQQSAARNTGASETLREGLSKKQLVVLLSLLARSTSPILKVRNNAAPVALLVKAVIETAPKEHLILNSKISLIQKINAPEIGPLLVKFAEPEYPAVVRSLAIAHAIKIGDADTFSQFNPYLSDSTVVGQFLVVPPEAKTPQANDKRNKQVISEVQIRDLCLLGKLRIAGEAHADFGFNPAAVNSSNNQVGIKGAGFITKEARDKAFERYQRSNPQ